MSKKYEIDLGDDEFVSVPPLVQNQIIRDHLMKSYHWSIGIGCLMVGFLLGIIATK